MQWSSGGPGGLKIPECVPRIFCSQRENLKTGVMIEFKIYRKFWTECL